MDLRNMLLQGVFAVASKRNGFRIAVVFGMILVVIGFFVLLLYYLINNRKIEQDLYETDTTGLLKLNSFYTKVAELRQNMPGEVGVVVRFSLNHWEAYVEIYGLEAGEKLLCALGRALLEKYRTPDSAASLCHIGCADFVAYFPEKAFQQTDFEAFLTQELQMLSPEFRFSFHGGIGQMAAGDTDVAACCDHSGLARQTAQEQGATFLYYAPEQVASRQTCRKLVHDLPEALKVGDIQPFFAPRFSLENDEKEICGAEVSLGWQHKEQGMIPQSMFEKVIRTCGEMKTVEISGLRALCRLIVQWQEEGITIPPLVISLPDGANAEVFLHEFSALASGVTALFTLSVPVGTSDETKKAILAAGFGMEYRECNLAVPDAIGQSEMLYRVDAAMLPSGEKEKRIFRSFCRMAHEAGMPVLACHVTDEDELPWLADVGCNAVTGAGLAPWLNAEEFRRFLTAEKVTLAPFESKEGFDLLDTTAEMNLLRNEYVGAACIVRYNREGIAVTRPNARFLEEIGTSFDENAFDGASWLASLPTLAVETFRQTVETALSDGSRAVASCEITVPVSEKTESRILRLTVRFLTRRFSADICLCTVRDITDKKRDLALREAKDACFAMVVENIPGGVARYRLAENQLVSDYFSPRYYEMRGYTAQEMAEMKNADLLADIHTDDRNNLADILTECMEAHKQVQLTYRVYCKDGRVIWVEMNAQCTTDAGEKYLFVYCSEFKPAEELDLLPHSRSDKTKLKRIVDPEPQAYSGEDEITDEFSLQTFDAEE